MPNPRDLTGGGTFCSGSQAEATTPEHLYAYPCPMPPKLLIARFQLLGAPEPIVQYGICMAIECLPRGIHTRPHLILCRPRGRVAHNCNVSTLVLERELDLEPHRNILVGYAYHSNRMRYSGSGPSHHWSHFFIGAAGGML